MHIYIYICFRFPDFLKDSNVPSSEAEERARLLETIQRNKAAALDARHLSAWPQSVAYQ